jgi:hypothetical protein
MMTIRNTVEDVFRIVMLMTGFVFFRWFRDTQVMHMMRFHVLCSQRHRREQLMAIFAFATGGHFHGAFLAEFQTSAGKAFVLGIRVMAKTASRQVIVRRRNGTFFIFMMISL